MATFGDLICFVETSDRGISAAPTIKSVMMTPVAQLMAPVEIPINVGSIVAHTLVHSIQESTPCVLTIMMAKLREIVEVATSEVYRPGGMNHCHLIPLNYTRVKVCTMNPEFYHWMIDHLTPEDFHFLRGCMNMFILWHKKDII